MEVEAAAARDAHCKKDDWASIVNPPRSARNAYPISTFTYVIVPRSSPKLTQLKTFITHAVTGGQKYAAALDFAPLPQNVAARDKAVIEYLY